MAITILNFSHGAILTTLLFLAQSGRAQSPGSPPDPYGNVSPSMGVIIVALIAALFFMFIFYICVRHCCNTTAATAGGGSLRAIAARSRRAQRGLDRAVIDSFPTFDYSAVKELKIGKGALECAVCLNEFEDDDTLRLIPKCDHVFHAECIDMWLVGHTTCPVCRSDLASGSVALLDNNAPLSQNDGVEDDVENPSHNRNEDEDEDEDEDGESMEQPLHRNPTMRRDTSIGRSRWLRRMKLARSFSTGHVAVKQWENMDRFTLRLPVDIREQLMRGKLVRSTSMVVLPRETSTRRTGYRTGFEGSSRGRFGSLRSDRDGQSTGWVFSLVPPFFSRAPSVRSTKGPAGSSRQGSLRGSVRTELTRLPV